MSLSDLMLLAIVIPLGGAVLISQLGRWPNMREGISLLTAIVLIGVIYEIHQNFDPEQVTRLLLLKPFAGLSISFRVEPLGLIFAWVASVLWLVTSLYAIGYMRAHHEKNQSRFFAFFAVAIACTMGIIFADNLLTLFLFYELLTLTTYPLVTHADTQQARLRGRVYLGVLMGSSILLMLPAMVVIWVLTGTLDFTKGGVVSQWPDTWMTLLYLLLILGIAKAGIMPLHRWLPAAMVAPTPVSALLHAVAVVKAGVFSILKVTIYIFGIDTVDMAVGDWLVWVPATTILVASVVALTRDNLKERLAYSTVGQLSYIVLAAVLANQTGIVAGSLHIAIHAFGKITLFFAAGAIMVVTHKTRVSELDGLGWQMPWTFTAFTLGAASIIGLPFFAGMWSKWYLMLAVLEADQMALLWVLFASSLLSMAYLLDIPMRAFLKGRKNQAISEAPWSCLLGMWVPALAGCYFFISLEPFYSLAVLLF